MTGFLWSDDSEEFFKKNNLTKKSTKKEVASSTGESSEAPWSVTQLNAQIKSILDQNLSSLWLVGEVSNLIRSGAGHIYFSLKDASNQISAVMWRSTAERLRVRLEDGMSVLCFGRVDVYGPRGNYQIVIQRLEEQGLGSLQAALRKLHAKLEQEGLFAPERKRPLPAYPRRVGFVTSPQGAAIHDFLQVLRRRWPLTNVLIIPTRVQGEGASTEIAHGIELANKIEPKLDVLVVGRGGGSAEDLWSFNEEVVVRAIAKSVIPTVSAVGHEIDVTLADLVADVRALTPSEAAELVVPNRHDVTAQIRQSQHRIWRRMNHRVQMLQSQLDSWTHRPVVQHPERLLEQKIQRLDELTTLAAERIDKIVTEGEQGLRLQCAKLEAMNPLKILGRGYSITTDVASGNLIASINQVALGTRIRTKLTDGEIESDIVTIRRVP